MAESVYKETLFDQEVSLADVLEEKECSEPIKLSGGNDGDEVDASASDEKAPPLPEKMNSSVLPNMLIKGDTSGGDMLKDKNEDSHHDREISIHDLENPASQAPNTPSASVKAFFRSLEDIVDASLEREPSFEYDMNHERRGWFVILNHMNFKRHLNMSKRNGTDRDRENLKKTAKNLGFDRSHIRAFDDLKLKEIEQLIHELSTQDHSKYDCFVLAVLTHGDEGDILYAQDSTYHIDKITEPFMANNCKTLAGKPKLFFIQACRGTNLDEGSSTGLNLVPVAQKHDKEIVVIPNAADFLLAFSTVSGYYAWRNQSDGSWFVQALCKCLSAFGDRLDLMQIMTRVNRMVAYDFVSCSKQNIYFDGKKQIPSIVTRLTGEVYFRSKKAKLLMPSGRVYADCSGQELPASKDAKVQESESSDNKAIAGELRETNL